jgi:hypothetical protein
VDAWLPSDVELMTDVSEADWVDERLLPDAGGGEGVRVGELVPTGFERYARILHPAHRRVTEGGMGEPVTWAEIARERGKRIHPEVQFQALVDLPPDHRVSESDEVWMPEEGSIPMELSAPLIDVLSRHTSTERCFFCLWDGFGFLYPGSTMYLVAYRGLQGRLQRRSMRRAARRASRRAQAATAAIPRVQIRPAPDRRSAFREYLLMRGALGSLTTFTFVGRFQSPNIWWPEDRAWVVATEIDDWTTYVGGTKACVEDLLASEALEVVPSDPTFRWDVRGDRINGADTL